MAQLQRGSNNLWTAFDCQVSFELRPVGGPPSEQSDLRENQTYQVLITAPSNASEYDIAIGGLQWEIAGLWRRGNVFGFLLKLSNEFGKLEITVTKAGRVQATCWAEVRPRHLDPATDFQEIMHDLQRVSYSMAYAIWKKTFRELYPSYSLPAGVPEWLGLLRVLWSRIGRAIREIEQDPDRDIVRRYDIKRAAQVTRLDPVGIRWLARNAAAWEVPKPDAQIFKIRVRDRELTPQRALSTRNEVTYDTPANRTLKLSLTQLERRLVGVLRALEVLPVHHFAAAQKAPYVAQLEAILRDVRRFLRAEYLDGVKTEAEVRAERVHMVRTDSRYRQALRAMQVLRWGLISDIGGPVAQMSLKDTWQLYEYWVLLYIHGIIADWGWDCTEQGVVQSGGQGELIIDVRRGDASRTRFISDEPSAGYRSITVFFHKKFPSKRMRQQLGLGSLTVERDVDIFIEIQVGGDIRRYVFDPKYRGEKDQESDCLTCPPSAINDMHVYRDSVGRWEPLPGGGRFFSQILDGAFAVFPSKDTACFSTHRFAASLEDGIGAVPLLPSPVEPRLLEILLTKAVGTVSHAGGRPDAARGRPTGTSA